MIESLSHAEETARAAGRRVACFAERARAHGRQELDRYEKARLVFSLVGGLLMLVLGCALSGGVEAAEVPREVDGLVASVEDGRAYLLTAEGYVLLLAESAVLVGIEPGEAIRAVGESPEGEFGRLQVRTLVQLQLED